MRFAYIKIRSIFAQLFLGKTEKTMFNILTKQVVVTVTTQYLPHLSTPGNNNYVFRYHIVVENKSDRAIKLLKRNWHIIDANGQVRIVEGEGVVGEMPVIQPGQQYAYHSICNFRSEIGLMHGHYLMSDLVNGELFKVFVPSFTMITPSKLN